MLSPTRTRIKICGLTRESDVLAAVEAGADAIGFVFYPPSPRNLSPERAAALARLIPPFVTLVGLFVEPSEELVDQVRRTVPVSLLQFHGDESNADCARYGLPWIKAARMRPGFDLIEFASLHHGASALLLDTFVHEYGGSGQTFDWGLVPPSLPRPVILSGGLNPDNVEQAVRQVRPWAVDVSSGVESAKGIKDAARIAAFVKGVKDADVR